MDQENYPNNFEEFIEQFQTEKDCIEYISSIRWPNGFKCPRCQQTKVAICCIARYVNVILQLQREPYLKTRTSHCDFGFMLCGS
jgi:transcription elongation factor Elf1